MKENYKILIKTLDKYKIFIYNNSTKTKGDKMKRTKVIYRGKIKEVLSEGKKENTYMITFNRKEICVFVDPYSGTCYEVAK